MFKPSSPLLGGLLWYVAELLLLVADTAEAMRSSGQPANRQSNRKTPWRISQPQKARQRKRLRAVDRVVDTVSAALQRNGHSTKAIERWYAEMPREEEMLPKDKYTIFDKKEKKYRKSIHSKSYVDWHLRFFGGIELLV